MADLLTLYEMTDADELLVGSTTRTAAVWLGLDCPHSPTQTSVHIATNKIHQLSALGRPDDTGSTR